MTGDHRIRPIHSEHDYVSALVRIGTLMDMKRSSKGDDEIEVLTILVEDYENKHFPMDAPDPVEAIKFRMRQRGISQSDLAPIFGNPAKASEVLGGKRTLTLSMIRAVHEQLEIPAEILIGEPADLPEPSAIIEFDRLPVAEMAKRGWIETSADLKNRKEEIVQDLIADVGGLDALPKALFHEDGSARVNAKTDVNALQAWCLHILRTACRAGLKGKYKPETVNPKFLHTIARLSSLDDGPKLAREKLAEHGIALVVAAHLSKMHLDGVALWAMGQEVPVVGMTIRSDRLDNFWFCLLHELAHIGRHFPSGSGEIFIDDFQLRERNQENDDKREREADEWAWEALIPAKMWNEHPVREQPNVQNVLSLARQADVHPTIVAGRIRHDKNNHRLLPQFVVTDTVRPLLMEDAAQG